MLGFRSTSFFVTAAAIVGFLGCGGLVDANSEGGPDEGAAPEPPRSGCASPLAALRCEPEVRSITQDRSVRAIDP